MDLSVNERNKHIEEMRRSGAGKTRAMLRALGQGLSFVMIVMSSMYLFTQNLLAVLVFVFSYAVLTFDRNDYSRIWLLAKGAVNRTLVKVICALALGAVLIRIVWGYFPWADFNGDGGPGGIVARYAQLGDYMGGLVNPLLSFLTVIILVWQWSENSKRENERDRVVNEREDQRLYLEMRNSGISEFEDELDRYKNLLNELRLDFKGLVGLDNLLWFNYDLEMVLNKFDPGEWPIESTKYSEFYPKAKIVGREFNRFFKKTFHDAAWSFQEKQKVQSELAHFRYNRVTATFGNNLILEFDKFFKIVKKFEPDIDIAGYGGFFHVFYHLRPKGAANYPLSSSPEVYLIDDVVKNFHGEFILNKDLADYFE